MWNKTHNLDVINQYCSAYINVRYFSFYCGFIRGLHFSFLTANEKVWTLFSSHSPIDEDCVQAEPATWLLEFELWNAPPPPRTPVRSRYHFVKLPMENAALENYGPDSVAGKTDTTAGENFVLSRPLFVARSCCFSSAAICSVHLPVCIFHRFRFALLKRVPVYVRPSHVSTSFQRLTLTIRAL